MLQTHSTMEFCNHRYQQQPRYNIVFCNDVNSEQASVVKESQFHTSRSAQTPTVSNNGSELLTVVGRVTCNAGHITEDGNVCENNENG